MSPNQLHLGSRNDGDADEYYLLERMADPLERVRLIQRSDTDLLLLPPEVAREKGEPGKCGAGNDMP